MSKSSENIRNIIKELNEEKEIKSAVDAFLFSIRDIDDPRDVERCDHTSDEILFISLVATICGATSYRKIATFGEAQQEWLQQFVPMKNGAPSRDTFIRFFRLLKPDCFQEAAQEMIRSLNLHDKTEHIAIDGKVSRGCYHTKGQCLLRDVSAWDTQNGISLGQVSTRNEEGKEMGEFYAIPELVRMIDVEDRIVTIDAGGYYTEITEAIVDGNGLFLITLKANQPKLHEAVILEFQEHEKQGWKDVPRYHESNTGHGRQEERTYYAIDIPREMVDPKWKDVKTVITGIFRRTIGEKTTQEQHYFISNLAKEEVERIGMALRSHWGIENSLHWVLDVNFGEDANRTREGDGAENLSILRKIALMILNQGRGKISVSNAMFRAAIDPTFRKQLILNIPL